MDIFTLADEFATVGTGSAKDRITRRDQIARQIYEAGPLAVAAFMADLSGSTHGDLYCRKAYRYFQDIELQREVD